MSNAWEFVKKHYVKGLAVLALILAFFLGSLLSKPKIEQVEKTVYVDRVVEKEVIKEVVKEVEVEKIVYKYIKKNETKVEKETTTKPDGTVVVKDTTTTNKDESTEEAKVVVKEVIKEVEVVKEVEKLVYQEKEVVKYQNLPSWDIDLRIGVSSRDLALTPEFPYVTSYVVGLDVERRILGPLSLGIWTQTTSFKTMEGGISASLQF